MSLGQVIISDFRVFSSLTPGIRPYARRHDSTGIGDDAVVALLPLIESFAQYSYSDGAPRFGLSLAYNNFGLEAQESLRMTWQPRPIFAIHT